MIPKNLVTIYFNTKCLRNLSFNRVQERNILLIILDIHGFEETLLISVVLECLMVRGISLEQALYLSTQNIKAKLIIFHRFRKLFELFN